MFGARTAGFFGESGLQLGIEFRGADRAGRLAQALDVVERPPLREKNVDHKVDVVEQDPFSPAEASVSTQDGDT